MLRESASDPGRCGRRGHSHAARGDGSGRTRLQRRRRAPSVDASVCRSHDERVAGSGRLLPSTRHQRHRRCVPDDVRAQRGLRARVLAVAAETQGRAPYMKRRIAWILILVVDASDIVWGFMAAAFPNQLTGPGGKPILVAGYEGFTRGSWTELVSSV